MCGLCGVCLRSRREETLLPDDDDDEDDGDDCDDKEDCDSFCFLGRFVLKWQHFFDFFLNKDCFVHG